jgi:hypothetical protein
MKFSWCNIFKILHHVPLSPMPERQNKQYSIHPLHFTFFNVLYHKNQLDNICRKLPSNLTASARHPEKKPYRNDQYQSVKHWLVFFEYLDGLPFTCRGYFH